MIKINAAFLLVCSQCRPICYTSEMLLIKPHILRVGNTYSSIHSWFRPTIIYIYLKKSQTEYKSTSGRSINWIIKCIAVDVKMDCWDSARLTVCMSNYMQIKQTIYWLLETPFVMNNVMSLNLNNLDYSFGEILIWFIVINYHVIYSIYFTILMYRQS